MIKSKKQFLAIIFLAIINFFSIEVTAGVNKLVYLDHLKYGKLTTLEFDAYTKGALESIMFVAYSKGLNETEDFHTLIDCLKENYSKLSTSAFTPWVFGRDLDKSLAHNIFTLNIPIVCEMHDAGANYSSQKTLKLTYYTDWTSWSESQKINYIGGYIDGAIVILSRLNDADSIRLKKNLQEKIADINFFKQMIRQLELSGFEIPYPLPWSIASAFGASLEGGKKLSIYNRNSEMENVGAVSLKPYTTYIDFKVLSKVCEPYFNRLLDKKTMGSIPPYLNSLQCHAEKSLSFFIEPMLLRFGSTPNQSKSLIQSLQSSYDEKLKKAQIEYSNIGSSVASMSCMAIIKNHKFSNYVLAEKLDAMKYQSNRVDIIKPIFKNYAKSIKSCPNIYSLDNSVEEPSFLSGRH